MMGRCVSRHAYVERIPTDIDLVAIECLSVPHGRRVIGEGHLHLEAGGGLTAEAELVGVHDALLLQAKTMQSLIRVTLVRAAR
jgi:hypothetical protein